MTTEAWVVDASLLILYARIDQLVLLEQLAPRLIIPEAVIVEVRSGHHKDRTAGRAIAWATQYRYPDIAIPATIDRWNLGVGESQVISYCLKGPRCAVLDDQRARRFRLSPYRQNYETYPS